MRRLAATAAALIVTACSQDASSILAQPRSMDFFLKNTPERERVLAECAKTQGSHGYQPEEECATARKAKQQVAREDYIRERTGGR